MSRECERCPECGTITPDTDKPFDSFTCLYCGIKWSAGEGDTAQDDLTYYPPFHYGWKPRTVPPGAKKNAHPLSVQINLLEDAVRQGGRPSELLKR